MANPFWGFAALGIHRARPATMAGCKADMTVWRGGSGG
jgi:hypothetical protein